MKSSTTAAFRKAYRSLPKRVQTQARAAYQLWIAEPTHPGLHFKRVHAGENAYSVRVGVHYRALALVENGHAVWFWIGSHAEYDKLMKTL